MGIGMPIAQSKMPRISGSSLHVEICAILRLCGECVGRARALGRCALLALSEKQLARE
jgi:hypothetical protein